MQFSNTSSSVDLKQAVQTSILSKRWKSLWTSLPNLDFNFRHLAVQSGVDLARSDQNRSFMPRFMHFVIQFLSQRDHSSNHGVQHLDIDAYCYSPPVKFPDGLFASKTLRELRLRQYIDSIVVPKSFVLPNRKTLYLETFSFNDDLYSFSREPFSSFPGLEKLTLHRCQVSGLIISAPKLRVLEISFLDPFFSREQQMELISTPSLTSFRYEGYVSLVCPKMEIPCLEEVYFDNFAVPEAPYTDDIKTKMPLNLIRMLQQIGNAKVVTLTLPTIEVIQLHLHGPVGEVTENFPNELVVFLFVEIKVLAMDPRLLEQSPSPFPYIKCLKLAKRHAIHPMKTVPRSVINYLTKASSYSDSVVVKFPDGING
ncbi:UNVERIFIED_CONTAM: putative F-box protein [Sesamum latifolium]|uniref:F-box protein n=1 Tax=Sesamum latifolium TaxID=2727402 RepID=A0AAW2WDS7_9LAMI